ncbi:MAG: lipoate--protein ligase family protein, partial [Anaerolineales bacterium]
PPAQGAWNMAVDEAILLATGKQRVNPTLRLYSWDPACLSLGYAQPISDVDQPRLLARGWDLVRRPTGGRAILHTDELTYAVIGPHDEPRLAGGVLESYQVLAGALLAALHNLSVPAESQNHPNLTADNSQMGAVCFEVPSNYEITVNGKKLLGSAQARRKEGILQHGTLPLYGDITRIVDVLEYPDQAQRAAAAHRLSQRATTVEMAIGHAIDWSAAAQAFASAFEDQLNLRLKPGELTDHELEQAQRIMREKYAHSGWTARH